MIELDQIRPGKGAYEKNAARDYSAVAGRRGPRPMAGYALRQPNGAYCPLFFPLVSFQLSPSASTWLFNA